MPLPGDLRVLFGVIYEANVWTWFNGGLLLAAVGACFLVAVTNHSARRGPVFHWALISAVLAGLSLDDVANFHERLTNLGLLMGGGSGFLAYAWIIPGPIVGLGIASAFVLLIRRVEAQIQRLLWSGLIAFLGGALGVEAVSASIHHEDGSICHHFPHIEELLEAFGAILFLCAGLAALRFELDADSIRVRSADPGHLHLKQERRTRLTC